MLDTQRLKNNHDRVGVRCITLSNICDRRQAFFVKIALFFTLLISYADRLIFGSVIVAAALDAFIDPLICCFFFIYLFIYTYNKIVCMSVCLWVCSVTRKRYHLKLPNFIWRFQDTSVCAPETRIFEFLLVFKFLNF